MISTIKKLAKTTLMISLWGVLIALIVGVLSGLTTTLAPTNAISRLLSAFGDYLLCAKWSLNYIFTPPVCNVMLFAAILLPIYVRNLGLDLQGFIWRSEL